MSDHFDGERFFNPGAKQARGLGEVLRWRFSSKPTKWPDWIDDVTPSKPARGVTGELRVTMINHATLLLQMDGGNILTDPIWSERTSPIAWAGPKRHRAPGVRFEDLPPIHLVLLSHNHYDHLDLPTIKRLAAEHRPQFAVPLGVAALLRSERIAVAAELDWWDRHEAITCVPAQHFSARGVTDRNRTLWCGYTIETPLGLVYFAADTGFGPHFAQIRERCGPLRAALLPIGAYKPEWFMGPVHMSPQDAIRAQAVLQPGVCVPIHFGTFQLTDEGPEDPLKELGDAPGWVVLRNGQSTLL